MLSLGQEAHDYNPHAQESEVGGFGVQDQQDPRKDGKATT